jgi:hypothetical protein
MRKYIFNHTGYEEVGRWSYMTLQPIPSEFPYTAYEENLICFFISAVINPFFLLTGERFF